MQSLLNLPLNQRTVLVTTATVRAVLGQDAESISARVDAGDLRWVFDVSAVLDGKRELRFWARELSQPELCPATPPEAIAQILGRHAPRWRGTEVAQLLLISRPQVKDLRATGALPGEIVGGTFITTTAALTAFLEKRLLVK